MARQSLSIVTSMALAVGQVAPALAQSATTREARPMPAVEPEPKARPALPTARPTRPSRPEGRPETRPSPGFERPVRPGRPGGGWGGSGGTGGGGSGWGGSGGSGWHWDRPVPPPSDWGGWGGSGGWGGNWQGWGGGYRRLTCESRNGRYRRCNADTQGRVGIIRTLSDTRCHQGYSWGYNRSHIWVSNGCRAEFAYGYGGGGWDDDHGRGPSASDVIAGVAVAGGLIALLSAATGGGRGGSNRSASQEAAPSPPPAGGGEGQTGLPYQPHSGPARIVADYDALPPAAQGPARVCMMSVAQQIGATGGSAVTWARTLKTEPGNGGYRFNVALKADYPDGPRDIAMYCRATPGRVVQLDFAALSG